MVVVTLADEADTPLPNVMVTFAATNAAMLVDPASNTGTAMPVTVVTDEAGQALLFATSSTPGPSTVSASWYNGTNTLSGTMRFVASAPVTSRTVSTPAGDVTLSVAGEGRGLVDAYGYDATATPTGSPSDLPFGLIALTVHVPNPGDGASVTFTLPAPYTMRHTYHVWKFVPTMGHPAAHWIDVTHDRHVSFVEQTDSYTLQLVDGGFGDADGVANGVIVDPSGVSNDPAGIPTLGEWAALLLGLLVIGLAVRRLRAASLRPAA